MLSHEAVEGGFDIWTTILCAGGTISLLYTIREFVRMTSKTNQNSSSVNNQGDFSDYIGKDSAFKPKRRTYIDPILREQAKNVKYDRSRRN